MVRIVKTIDDVISRENGETVPISGANKHRNEVAGDVVDSTIIVTTTVVRARMNISGVQDHIDSCINQTVVID